MKIVDIARAIPGTVRIVGDENGEAASLSIDSRQVTPGALFFCVPGMHTDAHEFAPQALEKGAVGLVVEHELEVACPQIVVENVRLAMAYAAAAFFGHPADALSIIGITGTKGKTTTSFLIKSILQKAGRKVGLIGTVCCMIGDEELTSGKTTPDPIDFQSILRRMVDAGVDVVVMEVSAHALAMHRVAGIHFAVAGFTNLSEDHFDYFGNMENYLAAKLALFTKSSAGKIVVNADDERVFNAVKALGRETQTIGIRERAEVYANNIEISERGCSFLMTFNKRFRLPIALKLSGIFNVYNAMMASALCDAVGVTPEAIQAGLESIRVVPGRVELLDTGTDYRVILDYAHSPDALENILTAIRQTTKGRLIALFGCGGDRDREKRPLMGEIGGRLADFCILTSDNPRSEDPMTILSAIEAGIRPTHAEYVVIENRRNAIRHALEIARPGDAVVLAGKGHETYQEISGVKHPFDEKIVVQELLEEIAGV